MTDWEIAEGLIRTIQRAGGEAYIVGGAVRDYLRGDMPDDIDLATSLFPEEVMALFARTIPTGIEHGTVTVLEQGRTFEVTTFRSEGTYSDARRPDDVVFGVSLDEDLLRRDFTMNAMAFRDGQVIDLFGGRDDLASRIIRTVGSAEERFREDALRIMRAFRFMAQLDFGLDRSLQDAASRLAPRLKHVAVERIAIEFEKLMLGMNHRRALQAMVDLHVIDALPQMSEDQVLAMIGDGRRPVNMASVWALYLLHADTTDLSPWKRSKATTREARQLVSLCESGLDPMRVYTTESTTLSTYFRMNGLVDETTALKRALPIESRRALHFDGRDAMELGATKRRIEQTLVHLERQVVEGHIANERMILLEEARRWLRHVDES